MFSNIVTQDLISPVTMKKIELPSGGDNSVAIILNGVLTPEVGLYDLCTHHSHLMADVLLSFFFSSVLFISFTF